VELNSYARSSGLMTPISRNSQTFPRNPGRFRRLNEKPTPAQKRGDGDNEIVSPRKCLNIAVWYFFESVKSFAGGGFP